MIPAERAKTLLDQSGLSPVTLTEIWSSSDIGNKGSLTWPEFVNALRWVSYYQSQSYSPEMNNISAPALPRPPPVLPSHPPALSNVNVVQNNLLPVVTPGQDPYLVSDEDRKEYTILFSKHENAMGFIDAHSAKTVFIQSELPRETLFHIWDLADRRKRGQLDLGEFIVASHLVVVANAFGSVPQCIPPALECEFDPQSEIISKNLPSDHLVQNVNPAAANDIIAEKENNGQRNTEVKKRYTQSSLPKAVSPRPRDLIESVIEGDRVMSEYLKEYNDKLQDQHFSMQDLRAEIVEELKEKREELTKQMEINTTSCVMLSQLENEVNDLRDEYTETSALRKEAELQNSSMSQKMAILQKDKEFLKRAIQNTRLDIKSATGLAGDLELTTKSANSSLSALSNNRHFIRETLVALKGQYATEVAETEDLERTLKRLEEEKARMVDNNRQQLEVINQGLQDSAVLANGIERDQKSVLSHVKDIVRDERIFVAKAPLIPGPSSLNKMVNDRAAGEDGTNKHLQSSHNSTSVAIGGTSNSNGDIGILAGSVTASGLGALRYGSINEAPRDIKGVPHGPSNVEKQQQQYGSNNWVQFNHAGR